jgi:hypothetical protein
MPRHFTIVDLGRAMLLRWQNAATHGPVWLVQGHRERRVALPAAGNCTSQDLSAVASIQPGLRKEGAAMPKPRIVKCSDGHLYTALWIPLVGLRSVRLGGERYARCPVDHHWRMTVPVDASELTEAELTEARQHDVGLQ